MRDQAARGLRLQLPAGPDAKAAHSTPPRALSLATRLLRASRGSGDSWLFLGGMWATVAAAAGIESEGEAPGKVYMRTILKISL